MLQLKEFYGVVLLCIKTVVSTEIAISISASSSMWEIAEGGYTMLWNMKTQTL